MPEQNHTTQPPRVDNHDLLGPLLTLPKAASWIARATGCPKPHTSTLTRWINRGVRGKRLPAVRAGGGRFMVRVTDLATFIDIRNGSDVACDESGLNAGQLEIESRQLAAMLGRDTGTN